MREKMEKIEYRISLEACICTLLGTGILFLIQQSGALAKGFFLGGAVSILGFLFLSFSVRRAVELPTQAAKRYTFFHYILRYALYGLTLYMAIVVWKLNIFPTTIGLFVTKIVILIRNIMGKNI